MAAALFNPAPRLDLAHQGVSCIPQGGCVILHAGEPQKCPLELPSGRWGHVGTNDELNSNNEIV